MCGRRGVWVSVTVSTPFCTVCMVRTRLSRCPCLASCSPPCMPRTRQQLQYCCTMQPLLTPVPSPALRPCVSHPSPLLPCSSVSHPSPLLLCPPASHPSPLLLPRPSVSRTRTWIWRWMSRRRRCSRRGSRRKRRRRRRRRPSRWCATTSAPRTAQACRRTTPPSMRCRPSQVGAGCCVVCFATVQQEGGKRLGMFYGREQAL